jgi:hypothetical protein
MMTENCRAKPSLWSNCAANGSASRTCSAQTRATGKQHTSGPRWTVCAFLAMLSPCIAGELHIYEHNGSVIDWYVVGNEITATYSVPRPGLSVRTEAVLFRGSYEDSERFIGTAYTFKTGCPPAPYNVIGQHEAGGKRIVLRGPAPTRARQGCSITGYSATSPHARLVLTFSATHH